MVARGLAALAPAEGVPHHLLKRPHLAQLAVAPEECAGQVGVEVHQPVDRRVAHHRRGLVDHFLQTGSAEFLRFMRSFRAAQLAPIRLNHW